LALCKVAVVGAAGHVGLSLALVLAEHDNYTVGIDVNEVAVDEIDRGFMPFYSAPRPGRASSQPRVDYSLQEAQMVI
jgi:UDP-N-acetyl-D-mannosaminuronate dehydrogenase